MNTRVISCMKALSDPTRVRAFMALRQGERCVCQIISLLKLAPSTVSKHMAILKQAGLVVSRKEGKWMHFGFPQKWPDESLGKIIKSAIEAFSSDEQIARDARQLDTICKVDMTQLCKTRKLGK